MDFALKIWKILVAIKDGLALFFLLVFFLLFVMLVTAQPSPPTIHRGPLIVSPDGIISEVAPQSSPLDFIVPVGGGPQTAISRNELVRALDAAAADHNINAIILDLDRFAGAGQATIADVGRALDRVRKAGKPVHAFATLYDKASYQLASHADKIVVDEMGGLFIAPPGGQNLYYADALKRFGVHVNIYRAGKYKSAVEPYLLSQMSDEAREDYNGVYSGIWTAWKADVQKIRPQAKLDDYAAKPAELLAENGGNGAKLGLASGLVDAVQNRDDFIADMNSTYWDGPDSALEEGQRLGGLKGNLLGNYLTSLPDDVKSQSKVAVVTVSGMIVDGSSVSGAAGGDTIARLVHEALDDKNIKALVLRVDSPGGSVMASEQIRRALLKTKKQNIPFVVSMGNIAASGGYWISTPAQRIFAENHTITGSIGAFGLLPTFQGTLEKLGVKADGVTLGPLSGQPDIIGGTNESFDRIAQSSIDQVYDRFLTFVAGSRGWDKSRVAEIAEGRVYSGEQAKQIGLIDEYGNIDAATAYAAKLAGLKAGGYDVQYAEPDIGFLEILTRSMQAGAAQILYGGSAQHSSARRDLFAYAAQRAKWQQQSAISGMQMLMSVEGAQVLCLACGAETYVPPGSSQANASVWRILTQIFN